ncbi:MAG: hypothetical protein H0U73_07360 [Tatlockia sp.]|nr:hypothetical protein [Tatlockia sp.]
MFKSYAELKECFADYYRIKNNELSFHQFSFFLNMHNFYAKELIFAPVFRNFIGAKIQKNVSSSSDSGDENQYQGIVSSKSKKYSKSSDKSKNNANEKTTFNSASEILDDGRYCYLDGMSADEVFYCHFGIQIKEIWKFEWPKKAESSLKIKGKFVEQVYKRILFTDDYPFGEQPAISLYVKNGHYEIQSDGENLTKATSIYNEEVNQIDESLNFVHNMLSSAKDDKTVNTMLDALQQAVTGMLNKQFQESKMELVQEPKIPFQELKNELQESIKIVPLTKLKAPVISLFNNNPFNRQLELTESECENPRFNRINNVINKYFSPQIVKTKVKVKTEDKVFDRYQKERAKDFKDRDTISRFIAFFLNCFGYQTEAEERKEYLEKLHTELNLYLHRPKFRSVDNILKIINDGLTRFQPRATKGPEYKKSLSYRLKALKSDIIQIENVAQESDSFRSEVSSPK